MMGNETDRREGSAFRLADKFHDSIPFFAISVAFCSSFVVSLSESCLPAYISVHAASSNL